MIGLNIGPEESETGDLAKRGNVETPAKSVQLRSQPSSNAYFCGSFGERVLNSCNAKGLGIQNLWIVMRMIAEPDNSQHQADIDIVKSDLGRRNFLKAPSKDRCQFGTVFGNLPYCCPTAACGNSPNLRKGTTYGLGETGRQP